MGKQNVRTRERTRVARTQKPEPAAAADVTPVVQNGLQGGGQPLDRETRGFLEPRFGHDFSQVRVHTDARANESAEAVQARAYTIGSDIAFGSGEYAPGTSHGQRLLSHELTHVVQQGGGNPAAGIPAMPLALQRAVKTLGGEWDTTRYNNQNDGTKDVGVNIDLKFVPQDPVDATMIGITQTANSVDEGTPIAINPTVTGRSIPSGEPGAGVHMDQSETNRNPMYAAEGPGGTGTLASTAVGASWGQHGSHYKDGTGTPQHQDALLTDTPALPARGKNASQIFETTALAIGGTQEGTYYGSVQWGWRTDASGTFTRLPLNIVSAGNPTAQFRSAAELWNAGKTSAGVDNIDLPISSVSSLTVEPTTLTTGELAVRIAGMDAQITKASGTEKTQLEFEKKALETELAKRGDQPTTSYATQETAAAAKSTEDIIKRLRDLASEIPGLPADATKTDRIIEKSALEAELPKRMIKVTVKVHETEDWLGADNVVVTAIGFGKAHRSGEKKLNNGDTGDFLVPLSALMWGSAPTLPIAIHIYDADWPDADDLMFETSWTPPFSPITDTQSRDGGRYEATIQFDK